MNTTLLPLTPASFSAALADTASWSEPYFDALFPLGMWLLGISVAVTLALFVMASLKMLLERTIERIEDRLMGPVSPADRYTPGTKIDYIREQRNYAAFKRFENQLDADDISESYK